MTFNNELSRKKEKSERIKWTHYSMYSVSHSTENWRVFNARHPMRIKATTTGLQAAERDRDREKEGSREEATHCSATKNKIKKIKNWLCSCWLSLVGTERNRLRFLTLYNSATFSHLDQLKSRRRKELVKGAACMVGVCVPCSFSGW